METEQKNCCSPRKETSAKKGFLSGVIYGLLPHSFCIAFVAFSAIGSVAAAGLVKKFLLIPYFFQILVILSFVFATISALIYLKRNNLLSFQGIKSKKKYLSILYATTISFNLIFFFAVFPAIANINFKPENITASIGEISLSSSFKMKVDIPCSGHSPLIIDEIRKTNSVKNVKFSLPNTFEVFYDPLKTSPEQIMSLDIFKTYKAEKL